MSPSLSRTVTIDRAFFELLINVRRHNIDGTGYDDGMQSVVVPRTEFAALAATKRQYGEFLEERRGLHVCLARCCLLSCTCYRLDTRGQTAVVD